VDWKNQYFKQRNDIDISISVTQICSIVHWIVNDCTLRALGSGYVEQLGLDFEAPHKVLCM
jgi:hypothetical protein